MKSKSHFVQAEIVFLSRDQGGRRTLPIGDGYPPHLVVEGTKEMLGVKFGNIPDSTEFNRPFSVKLLLLYHPNVDYSSLTEGRHFEIKEGPRTVGHGVVTRESFT